MATIIIEDFMVEENWRPVLKDQQFEYLCVVENINKVPYIYLHILISITLVRWLILNSTKIAPSELKQIEREISLCQKPKAISQELPIHPSHANATVMVSSEVVQNILHQC